MKKSQKSLNFKFSINYLLHCVESEINFEKDQFQKMRTN